MYIIAPLVTYTAYKIANMTNPHLYFSRFFRHDPMMKYEIANSSMVNALQAANVHFENVKTQMENCWDDGENWFQKYAGMNLQRGFGDLKKKQIVVPTVPGQGSIFLHSFDSTAQAPEGLKLILGIIDEPSRAETPATYAQVMKLWRMYIGNVTTRFPKNVGKVIAFSYLNNSAWDFTDTLLKQAEEERKNGGSPTIYAVNYSTFECNPNADRNSKEVEQFYKNDPLDAKARFEGIKGASKEGFYQPHVHKIRECFFENITPAVEWEPLITEQLVESESGHEIKQFASVALTKIRGDNKIRALVFDPAEKYDAFVLKMGYIESMKPFKDSLFIGNNVETIVLNKRPIIDTVIVWQPRGELLPVDYLSVGKVIGTLLTHFPGLKRAVSDKYNSVKLMQEIMARGVSAETLGYSNTEQYRLYLKARWMFWNNIPRIIDYTGQSITRSGQTNTVGEWNKKEHEELLRISGFKVDHPAKGSKDFSDTDAILLNVLSNLEVELLEPGMDQPTLAVLEQALRFRQMLRNDPAIPKSAYVNRLGELMNLDPKDAQELLAHVDEEYPE